MVSGLIITLVAIVLYMMFFYEYGRIETEASAREQQQPEAPKLSPAKSQRITFGDE
jgi:hypothetical protein